MTKTFLNIIIILFLPVSALINSCSSVKSDIPMKVIDFQGVSEIKKGEKAVLRWDIENADKVRIRQLQRNYNSRDSVLIMIDSTSEFDFIVTGSSDSLKLVWKIYVDDTSGEITAGPIISGIKNQKPSFVNSTYLRGIQSVKAASPGKFLKIMSYKFPFESKNSIRANALLLDEFGNYISGLDKPSSGFGDLRAETGCSGKMKFSPVTGFKEIGIVDSTAVDFVLLLDNSAIAGDYYPIYDQISEFVKSVPKQDRFALYNFNQNFTETIPLKLVNEIEDLGNLHINSNGLSSIFKSLHHTINKLTQYDLNRKKVIVMIAYSTDNASIIYDRNDIIEKAVESDIPVYVLGVGNAVDSYSLRSIAELSGARYYPVEESELNNISLILNEILFSQRIHYKFDVSVPPLLEEDCEAVHAYYSLIANNSTVYDTLMIKTKQDRHEFPYMAAASFEHRDTVVSDDYLESVKFLAEVMKNNPGLPIELIGNASIEGNESFCYNLGLKRAQAVRRILILYGADPSNIRIRSDGSNNPIYYLQERNWMQYYNRRVEIKWLDPELLPYEIIAQTSETESEALEIVENWEDKGYRAYYERYLRNNIPNYRIKIWGFSTINDAEKTAKKLSSDYGTKFLVQ
ncbi:MAG: OmpA family protein [Candidatus Kapaibacterium sp.]|jgi:outer membrane protein OmpA-like peptidoglycan-associated protein|nr:OmpA family protein [Candidatus Kapabacteria bacterium]